MASPAEPDVTEDRLLGGRLRFFQPRLGYRVAIDPVLLAAAVPAEPGQRVLDVGTGTGAAALCLAWRVPGAVVHGLERNPELLALACRNAAANAAVAPVQPTQGDLLRPTVPDTPFDHVMTNPPYHRHGASTPPAAPTAAAAHLADAALSDWLGACLGRLQPLAWLTVIHRTGALAEILGALAGRAGDVVVYPLWPHAQAPAAKRVIVAARKAGRGQTRLARGLVLHRADGSFTDAAQAVLRDGAGLPI